MEQAQENKQKALIGSIDGKYPWELHECILNPFVDITNGSEPFILDESGVKWFQYEDPEAKPETAMEALEKETAIQEQINMGILRVVHQQPVQPQQPQNQIKLNTDNRSVLAAIANKPEKKKVGPNEKCPCGSNLKYKKCHGR